jgi:YidC/Oxa1 family membrane protein insertase
MVPFANIFQPLIDVFEGILVFIHDHIVGGSWGFAIIGLTIVVRAAILPLTLKQFKSMQALQRLAPEIKALQERYKDDKQRLNEEMMKFYRENQVNPLGSCLPLLLQLPVFLSLFYMLRKDLKLDICGPASAIEAVGPISSTPCEKVDPGSAQFLFIPDLTDKATGGVLVVLILLYVGTQLASSVLMSVSADPMQRRLMMVLPLIFVAFIINFPAGLIVYWITTNTWTIGQQYVIRRTMGPVRPAGAEPVAAGGGGLAGLLGGGRGGGGGSGGSKPAPATAGDGGKPKAKAGGGGGSSAAPAARPKSGPPPSARRKKKRSGRRR